MRWKEVSQQTCSISRSLAIFGDTWTLLVIRQIFLRIRRFSDIQASLGITKHRLSDRLNRLIEEDIIYKELYDAKANRYEYRLTERGLDIYPILMSITQWGNKWASDDDGDPVTYVHKSCGHVMNPVMICGHCGDKLDPTQVVVNVGPGISRKAARGELSEIDEKMYSKSFKEFSTKQA